mgnify:CR=1 FL=1
MNKRKIVNVVAEVLKYAILIAGAIFTLLPFLWMILSSLKTSAEITAIPPSLFPKVPQFSNFAEAWKSAPFPRYIFNTLVVTIISTAGVLVTTVLAAYAFARLNFLGKKIMLSLMLATLMIPGEMLIITNFITITKLKWINTYQAMIVPYLASVFYIYLLTQFFSQVPDALYLAAKVDKCNDFKYLIKIMIPINKSPITTVCILNAIGCWNSFMWPLIVTMSDEHTLLSVGLLRFRQASSSNLHNQMAAACIVLLPMVIFYIVFHKKIMEGVASGGTKG